MIFFDTMYYVYNNYIFLFFFFLSPYQYKLFYNTTGTLKHYLVNIFVYVAIVIEKLAIPNATFNNFSSISWRSVLLVEETRRKPPDLS